MAGNDKAAAADNAVADNLPDDAFNWGVDGDDISADDYNSDGGIVTDETQLSEEDIRNSADGTVDTETQEELGEQAPAGGKGKAPAAQGGQQPTQAPAGSPQPQQQAQPPQAPASVAPESRQPAFHEMINANFDKAVDYLAGQGAFRLAPQDADKFDDETRQVMERQSAAVYLKSVATFSEILHTTLPGVVQALIGVTNSGNEQENQFYRDYGFDKAQHDAHLRVIMHNVRSIHPQATAKQIMDETARIGYVMLNVQPPAKPNGGAKPNGAGKPAQQRVVARQAFAPAGKPSAGAPQNRRPAGVPAPKPDPMVDLAAMLGFSGDLPD